MNLSSKVARCCVVATFAFALAGAVHADGTPAQQDPDAIRHVLLATFDQPQARLRVEPVVVRGDSAIAGWVQGERGGRALLMRKADGKGWEITLCAGDGLKDTALLRDAGLSIADAQALSDSLIAAESRLGADMLAKFASFDSVVRMSPNGEHPPGHGAGNPHHEGQHHAH